MSDTPSASLPEQDNRGARDRRGAASVVACALGGCAGGGAGQRLVRDGFDRAVAVPPWRSNRSTVRRRRCSTAWSACSTANRSCATCRSSPARAALPTACAAISRRRWCAARTVIAWVWDVYDNNQQRALRLSGEEAAGKAGRDAWAAADDLVLRKIAQAGLSGLSGMINGTPDAAPAPAPDRRGPAVASAEGGRTRPGCARRRRARLQRPIKRPRKSPVFGRFLTGKTAATGCQPSPLPDISSPIETRRFPEDFSIC